MSKHPFMEICSVDDLLLAQQDTKEFYGIPGRILQLIAESPDGISHDDIVQHFWPDLLENKMFRAAERFHSNMTRARKLAASWGLAIQYDRETELFRLLSACK